jgi:hypothetical protein
VSYYRSLATSILRSAYRLEHGQALTVQELLERLADEDDQERVLADDRRTRIRRLESLTSAIRIMIDDCFFRRVEPPLIESELAPGSFVFRFADSKSLKSADRELYARFRLMPQMITSLYELTPREFEMLTACLLKIIGCRRITVTQSQKDDGVDAIGELPLSAATIAGQRASDSPFYRVAGHLSFLVYAQAKLYAEGNKVGQETVQELAGSWQSMRNQYFDGTLQKQLVEALSYADLRAADPVLMMLVTTSFFTRGALEKALAMGIVTLDQEQLAQLLLISGFGLDSAGDAYAVSEISLRVKLESEAIRELRQLKTQLAYFSRSA